MCLIKDDHLAFYGQQHLDGREEEREGGREGGREEGREGGGREGGREGEREGDVDHLLGLQHMLSTEPANVQV